MTQRGNKITRRRLLRIFYVVVVALVCCFSTLLLPASAAAHPFFNTTVALSIKSSQVQAHDEIPISELGLALHKGFRLNDTGILAANQTLFQSYLEQHIKPTTIDGRPWKVNIRNMHMTGGAIPYSLGILKAGQPYQKLAFDITMIPPHDASDRIFNLGYTAVVAEVPAHSVLVSIDQDWASGVTANHPAHVGIITYDFDTKRATPLRVDVSNGNLFTGFIGMVKLGMNHIRTGTDHLLFLLTLLLPAPLMIGSKRWVGFGGTRRTLRNILKITTAFTIGHSLTLIIATLARLHISSQPVEALIAVSIIVSAVHALRPIFPGKEMWVAGGFGLIHGTAFSFVLAELHLNTSQTVTSLLGFNVGIELMQLLIIGLVIPPLIVFARTPAYAYIRIGGATVALVAAIGWFFARIGYVNPVGTLADSLSGYADWIVIALIAAAAVYLLRSYYETHPVDEFQPAHSADVIDGD